MTFQRGDVVLVPFPFSDLSTTKVRPALVISSPLYRATEPDLILAALTSRVASASGPLQYTIRDWEAAGLPRPTALKLALFTLDPARVLHRVGTLTSADLAQVDQRLRLALGL